MLVYDVVFTSKDKVNVYSADKKLYELNSDTFLSIMCLTVAYMESNWNEIDVYVKESKD